jgi:hypothetical protein
MTFVNVRPFDQMQLHRRRLSVIASNPGEVSDRQGRDTSAALEYLSKWAAELHVSDLLERALGQAS